MRQPFIKAWPGPASVDVMAAACAGAGLDWLLSGKCIKSVGSM